jgi:hypothetical protein
LIVAVEVNLVVDAIGRVAIAQLVDDVRLAGRCAKGRNPVVGLINWLVTVPGLITPGQRTRQGTRKAPSQLVFFSERNQVMAPSGQVFMWGPLSVL